jgi:hypothetical protein
MVAAGAGVTSASGTGELRAQAGRRMRIIKTVMKRKEKNTRMATSLHSIIAVFLTVDRLPPTLYNSPCFCPGGKLAGAFTCHSVIFIPNFPAGRRKPDL